MPAAITGNMDVLADLRKGERIFVRVESTAINDMEQAPFIPVVSLRTEEKVIFTVEDYNAYQYMIMTPVRANLIGVILVLFVFIFSYLLYSIVRRIRGFMRERN